MAAEKFKIRQEAGQAQIWDPVRKKWVALTPEEKVRQWLIVLLNEQFKVPYSLMSVEKGLTVNGLQKRFDLMVYNKAGKAVLIAECKAPDVPLTQSVCEQIAIYNSQFLTPYLLLSNANALHLFKLNETKISYSETVLDGQNFID
jgi:hypothetical protein